MEKQCTLYKKQNNNLKCLACAHKCIIPKNKTGICGVRKNINNKLYLLVYNKIISANIDPITKKPLYHFLPNTYSFSIGTVGCNFKCDWCQNADISQASKQGKIIGHEVTPQQIIQQAIATNCKSISYTYNEPIIAVEFYKEIAILAKKQNLKNIMVTNGYWSEESFNYISPLINAVNIDLKSFSNKTYQKYCGAKLEPVLQTIKRCHKTGIHIEITTLIIPGLNDSLKELESIAKFILSIDKNIPWHLSRFFPMYKMTSTSQTPVETLQKAKQIGEKYLKYVYVGNA